MVKDREVGCTAVHGVAKSWKWLSDWTKLVEVIEIQLSCFKSSKLILLKCYTQYDSKFGERYDPMDIGNLIFGSSAFSKSSLYIYNFLLMYCWSLAWMILSITLLACEMSSIAQ